MRFTEDQVRQAFRHSDKDVRFAALQYFAKSFSTNPTIMLDVIDVVERHGPQNAFTYSFGIADLAQTEATITWAVKWLQRHLCGALAVFLISFFVSAATPSEAKGGQNDSVETTGSELAKPDGCENASDGDDSAFQQWMKNVADLTAEKQLAAVAMKLRELNPEFDGWQNAFTKIENDVVTELGVNTDHVTDISPVRALLGLKALVCGGSRPGEGMLSDLSPLRGMPLTKLICINAQVVDLSPLSERKAEPNNNGHLALHGLPELTNLALDRTPITDAELIHLEGLAHLRLLSLSHTKITNAGLIHLRKLPQLMALILDGTLVTDAGLEQLVTLTSLIHLQLKATKVTDNGLARIGKLTNLKILFLDGTQVTDAGLGHLKGLTQLGSLSLNETPIADAGLAHLEELREMQYLNLRGTKITDAGLTHLQGLARLASLALDRTEVTDAGMSKLKHLNHLTFLSLKQTEVTDAGLLHLQELTQLKNLLLYKTKVTNAGVALFKEARPDCSIGH